MHIGSSFIEAEVMPGFAPQGTTHEVRSGAGQSLTITWLDPDEPEPRLIEGAEGPAMTVASAEFARPAPI
jgi:hypothetical protein